MCAVRLPQQAMLHTDLPLADDCEVSSVSQRQLDFLSATRIPGLMTAAPQGSVGLPAQQA